MDTETVTHVILKPSGVGSLCSGHSATFQGAIESQRMKEIGVADAGCSEAIAMAIRRTCSSIPGVGCRSDPQQPPQFRDGVKLSFYMMHENFSMYPADRK